MATSPCNRNGIQNREYFHKFFEGWLLEQGRHMEELVSASRTQERIAQTQNRRTDSRHIRALIDSHIQHYEHYYNINARYAKKNILAMFNPSWLSSLENAFLWIGGWRPSIAFHLLYSKSGLQMEAKLEELIRGIHTGDLGDLAPEQMAAINEMQMETVKEERKISERLAKLQEKVADPPMVEVSSLVTEMLRAGEEEEANAAAAKEEGMAEVLQKADGLRLKTLKNVIKILSPLQSAYFLIAAAELHLRVHDWGRKRTNDKSAGQILQVKRNTRINDQNILVSNSVSNSVSMFNTRVLCGHFT